MGGYLRHHQVEEIESEKYVIERTLKNRQDIQDRANLENHIRKIDRQIESQAPPDLTGEERDQAVRECREIEERLVPLMPSDEEMRRNPAGTVGRHKKWDKATKRKDFFDEGDLARWKNNQLALNKGDDDPDIANFERMRPLHNNASMLGAQIPGTQYFGTNPSPAYLAGYDETFGKREDDEPESADEVDEVEALPCKPKATRKKKGGRRKKATRKKKG
jgi:hypothetical protein